MPITIYPSFWVTSFLIAFMSTSAPWGILIWMAIVFVSVLVHEFGHALMAMLYKQKVRIELGAFGGATIYQSGPTLSPIKEFIVVLMGPLFGFSLAITASILQEVPFFLPVVKDTLHLVVVANIFWSILNLLPVFPLDGGKLIGILCEKLFGKRGLRLSYILSTIFAALLTFFFLVRGAIIAGSLFLLFAFESYRAFKDSRALVTKEELDIEKQELLQARAEWQNRYPEQAFHRLEGLIKKTGSIEAIEQLGQYLLLSSLPKKASHYLGMYEKRLTSEGLRMLQLALYQSQDYEHALKVGEKVFLEVQDAECALLNAFCAARVKKASLAAHWLKAAAKLGKLDMQAIVNSEDFELVRSDPLFQSM